MNINIPDYLLKMPKFLPNDIEGMIFTYPNKFPEIIKNYEEAARKYATDPKGFRAYGDEQLRELELGLEKIKNEYAKCENKDLEFLVRTDEKLNKLFCFRFWIVNYLFADGPIHSFYVDNLKRLTQKVINIAETEKYEEKLEETIQTLLQADYADEYLSQALNCNLVIKVLESDKKIRNSLKKVTILIEKNPIENSKEINNLWEEIWKKIKDNDDIKKLLHSAISQSKFRKSNLPLYNILTNTIEFKKENEKLQNKQDTIQMKINKIFEQAKKELNKDEYNLYKMSYEQAKNFAMYKDVMGSIDGKLLPFWYGIHDDIKNILTQINSKFKSRPTGQAAMYYFLVWYLPNQLKAIVMTPDFTDFSLERL